MSCSHFALIIINPALSEVRIRYYGYSIYDVYRYYLQAIKRDVSSTCFFLFRNSRQEKSHINGMKGEDCQEVDIQEEIFIHIAVTI